MNLHLSVERLILEGISIEPGQIPLLREALEAELARLLGENGLNPQLERDLALAGLRAGPIMLAEGGDPALLGAQIAQAVYAGIGQPAESPAAAAAPAGKASQLRIATRREDSLALSDQNQEHR